MDDKNVDIENGRMPKTRPILIVSGCIIVFCIGFIAYILVQSAKNDPTVLTVDPNTLQELFAALQNGDSQARSEAAKKLGDLQDERAVEPLIKALEGNLWNALQAQHNPQGDYRIPVVKALGQIKNKRAIEFLNLYVCVRSHILLKRATIQTLRKIEDSTSVEPLVYSLSHWNLGPEIADALEDFKWKPRTTEEKILYYVAKRNHDKANAMWDEAKPILLGYLKRSIDAHYALNSLLYIRGEEVVPELLKRLDDSGDIRLAEVYLNSGSDTLKEAAEKWAKKNGYDVGPL